MQHLKTPVDLAGQSCLSPALVQQALDTAYPYPDQGFIIRADDAPDVVTYPELETFLWHKTVASVPSTEIYYYDGAAWTLLPLVDGSLLADGSVPIAKLEVTGASAFDILQVNADADELVFTDIPTAVQAGSLNPNKLTAPDAISNYVLTSLAGVVAFQAIADFLTAISAGTLPVSKLVNGTADYFLRMNAAGTAAEWRTADLSAILASGALAGQIARRNAGNTGWEYYTPDASTNSYAVFEERTADGVDGPVLAAGWNVRDLNTEVVDTDTIGSVAASQVSLAAGTYRFRSLCVSRAVEKSRTALYNATATAYIAGTYSISVYNGVNDDAYVVPIEASGEFTLAADSLIELHHYVNSTQGNGGEKTSAGVDEIYARLELWKIA